MDQHQRTGRTIYLLGDQIARHLCDMATTTKQMLDAIDVSALQPSLQTEANTRMLLHVHHARENGFKNILIRTVDIDALIAVAMDNCGCYL